MRSTIKRSAGACAAAFMLHILFWAAPPAPASGLLDLSIEDLAGLTVTSVSKQAEPLSKAAAAIHVVTAADIRRAGVANLAEALQLVPGVFVARQNSSTWVVTARGFNSPLADKLEVLLDGRRLYSPLFSGVYWDQQDTLLEDIERIEVIRGPGASLWGTNAVNGVINIITRSGAETQGSMARLSAGTEQRYRLGLRQGFPTTNGGWRLWASGFGHAAFAAPATTSDEDDDAAGDDDWWHRRVGLRADWGPWDLDLGLYEGLIHAGTGDLETAGGHLRILRALGKDRATPGHWQVYFDQNRRAVDQGFGELRRAVDAELQLPGLRFGHWSLLAGVGANYSHDQLRASETLSFDPPSRGLASFNAFGQAILDRGTGWRLILGSKLEQHEFIGLSIQPSIRASRAFGDHGTLWAAISRALRAPNRLDRDSRRERAGAMGNPEDAATDISGDADPSVQPAQGYSAEQCIEDGQPAFVCESVYGTAYPDGVPTNEAECREAGRPGIYCEILFSEAPQPLVGNPHFRAEELLALELGARGRLAEDLAWDLALFYNRYDELRSVDRSEQTESRISNDIEGDSYGAELELNWTPRADFRVELGYSWLRLDLQGNTEHAAIDARARSEQDPEHLSYLRVLWQLGSIRLHGALRHVSPLRNLAVATYTELDLTVAWVAASGFEARLVGTGLLSDSHHEYGGPGSRPRDRGLRLDLIWKPG